MANPWKQFFLLIPGNERIIGTILSHESDGMSTVQLPEGGVIRARGQDVAVGLRAFILNGVLDGVAPDLPTTTIEI